MRMCMLAVVLIGFGSTARAATLHVDVSGELLGSSGVEVAGFLYDVELADGTCIDLSSGCGDATDFFFSNGASAILASQALLDQMFLDVPSGDFDSTPILAAGCNGVNTCVAMTAYGPPPTPTGHVPDSDVTPKPGLSLLPAR